MRLLKQMFMNVLWSHRFPQATVRAGRRWSCFQSLTAGAGRTFYANAGLRKDSSQAHDLAAKKLDLDVWKSVMRSSQPQVDKEEDDNSNDIDDDDEEECSTLESSRELVEMWRLAGRMVPEQISEEDLQALTALSTKSSKKKFLKRLALKEHHKKADKEKKERKRAQKEAERQRNAEGEEEGADRPLRNTFLMHFWSRSMDALHNWRAAQSMCFGQPLVFDMSYERNMSKPEMASAVSQLLESEGWNRRSADPFHLHFCNLQPEGTYHQELLKRYGRDTWDRLLITTTEQHYMDLFPKSRVVYLTADSRNVLRTFDHDKVYIVGAMVDKSIQTGLSLANAKRLQLATARLPLDDFLHWDMGSKNLTLDQMMRILLTLKEGGNWEQALEFVPKRKHDGFSKAPQLRKQTGRISERSEANPRTGTRHNKWVSQSKVITMLNTSRIKVSDVKTKRTKNWWDEE
ncbi:tRNA methyltransferase 10 homolog C [Brienomyrus brachyistius]|uniref:tRNA methyltransferase 10 homolog C n=1 Tax=Brienomyrus brachyistius TaxID=42636 RepID=UPI0020B34793|nr:tRNA methyltransferase 10 homolog C [Brienomyrus brachyistius]XP_048871935.1 tRNA methyltransferase 10 homolog C [Brienomyrus brachyistius]